MSTSLIYLLKCKFYDIIIQMIESLKHTEIYKSLNLMQNLKHAYLFFSLDKELNNNIAMLFAKQILCENQSICGVCSACKQVNSLSHPDFYVLNQESIKVEHVDVLIRKLATKPISASKKIFVILNAENINEISQNKILKSLEEPNSDNIFILSTSRIDKLLPTVLSRLHKITLPKLSSQDKLTISTELLSQNINIKPYLSQNLNLTDIINVEINNDYKNSISAVKFVLENLKSSKDIPVVVSSLPAHNKTLFLEILQKSFLACVNNEIVFDVELCNLIKENFSTKALVNCLPHIEKAYRMHCSNVVFSYILDNLLFNILKEKFLCKQ